MLMKGLMKVNYNPKDFEKKWQDLWEEKGVFHASNDTNKPKFYALTHH